MAIVIEGGLSFLGLGVPPPKPSWGAIIAAARPKLDRSPHISLIPAAVMFVTVLALNTVGEGIRRHLDRRRGCRVSPPSPRTSDPRAGDDCVLRVDGLTTHLRSNRGTVRAVDGVSLEVERGSHLGDRRRVGVAARRC